MKIGIVGGSGLYDMEGIEGLEEKRIDTPFGPPSDCYFCGTFDGKDICFLPRHARGHRLLPSEINHRANIYGFKKLGVDCLVSVSAVGSLNEAYRPGDIVLPDQYFDRTKSAHRHTFFGRGIVAHIAFGDPVCAALTNDIESAAKAVCDGDKAYKDVRVHKGGIYVNMEGPAFSTKAESHTYRKLGFDIIGMTSLAEAKLCREAEICYACMAMVTDYDCWHETEEAVSVEMVIATLMANVALAQNVVRKLVESMPDKRDCPCRHALASAIMTRPETIPAEVKMELEPIVGKYL